MSRIGSDRIGSDRIGSDRIGSDEVLALIARSDRQHDFGSVISKPGLRLIHRYRLANQTTRKVEILEVINRKACCGILEVGKTSLLPGEATEIGLTLVVDDKIGAVVHEAEVVTDLPAETSIVLRTFAEAYPAFQVEQITVPQTILVDPSATHRVEFRVIATGTRAEPPFDLDRAALRSSIPVEWVGPKEPGPLENGMVATSRRFAGTLEARSPGDRRAEVLIQDGDHQTLVTHVANWSVISPVSASPKLVVIKPSERLTRVVLKSRDDRPFRVLRIESDAPGIEGRSASPNASLSHVVEIEGRPASGPGRGVIFVITDHPSVGKIELPYFVIE